MVFLNRFFPHLLPQDIPVWQRFLEKYGDDYTHIEYDVRVGKGREAALHLPILIRQMALDLSMRRIDAVAHTSSRITIIEITRRADLKAVGQLTTYPVLYAQTFHPSLPIFPLLVAEELHSDIEPALRNAGIPWLLFPSP